MRGITLYLFSFLLLYAFDIIAGDFDIKTSPYTFSSGYNYFSYTSHEENNVTIQPLQKANELLYNNQNTVDTAVTYYPKNVIHFEMNFLFLMMAIRLNYEFFALEHPTTISYFRIGIGYMAFWKTYGPVFPLSYHIVFNKEREKHFELGIGFFVYRMTEYEDVLNQVYTSKSTKVLPDITLGLRRQNPSGGTVLKFGFFPVPSLGIAVGGAF
ncbi:MAG: hypothetical protein OEY51_04715 [Cyclobacteriaceae bacterium]|nr:hypothetical protein [Cyclobacteriaceae bacterium]